MLSVQRHVRYVANKYLCLHSHKYTNSDVSDVPESEAQNYGYAPETIDIISHAHLDFINPKQRKKIDKMEDEISTHLESGFQVYEYDNVPIWNPDTLFQVGHRDQFNQYSVSNIFKLYSTFMYPESMRNQWTISKSMKNELELPNTHSIIDYYPFRNTFSEKMIDSPRKKSQIKKHSKIKQNNWKRIPNEKYKHLSDSFGANMPFLTRDDQELIIWRDIHDSITNMHKIQTLIREYKPDIIVLEGCMDESTMKIYNKSSYNMYLSSVNNIFSRIVSAKHSNKNKQERFGRFMQKISNALFIRQGEIQCGSFANHSVIKYIKDNNNNKNSEGIQLVFGDLALDICGVLMVIATYLDTFQLPMLMELLHELDSGNVVYENVNNDVNFEDIYRNLYFDMFEDKSNLSNLLNEFLSPHSCMVDNYRNHFISLAINEAVMARDYTFDDRNCKVLAVMGGFHVNDVIYKLENLGNNAVINPFKDVTERMVLLKPSIPIKSVNFVDTELSEKEQEFVVNQFGNNLLNVFQNKLTNLKEL